MPCMCTSGLQFCTLRIITVIFNSVHEMPLEGNKLTKTKIDMKR